MKWRDCCSFRNEEGETSYLTVPRAVRLPGDAMRTSLAPRLSAAEVPTLRMRKSR